MDAHPRCGVLGVRLVGRDGGAAAVLPLLPDAVERLSQPHRHWRASSRRTRMVDDCDWAHDAVRACDWVPGCYYLVRREVVDSVGLFDPRFFLYYEEVDHCRARQGRRLGGHLLP